MNKQKSDSEPGCSFGGGGGEKGADKFTPFSIFLLHFRLDFFNHPLSQHHPPDQLSLLLPLQWLAWRRLKLPALPCQFYSRSFGVFKHL